MEAASTAVVVFAAADFTGAVSAVQAFAAATVVTAAATDLDAALATAG